MIILGFLIQTCLFDLDKKKWEVVISWYKSFYFNWGSLITNLNSHYETCTYKKEVQNDYSIQELYLERIYSVC